MRRLAILLACSAAFLPAQEDGSYRAERVIGNLQYGDGIAWSRVGYLVYADVRQGKLFRADSDSNQKVMRQDDGGAEGLAMDFQGRLYICEALNRRVTRLDRQGQIETLADSWQGKKFNSPNDIVVRRDGNVYFTDPAFGSAADHSELGFNGIFHLSPKGDLEIVAQWKTRPNGIAFSPDGRVLYVSDSDRHAIVAFDIDRGGAASNQRDLIKNIEGVPGGIKTDVDGRIYVAALGLAVYAKDGRRERKFLDNEVLSNCAFGDNDFETLYVTSRKGLFRIRLSVKGALQY